MKTRFVKTRFVVVPAEFKDSYGREMMLAREHCVEEDLITLPEGEVCRMVWLPTYLRASLPIAVMGTSPPFEPGLESEWLIHQFWRKFKLHHVTDHYKPSLNMGKS